MLIPAVLVRMNLVYALSATPAGILSDRMDRQSLLIVGPGVLIADTAPAKLRGTAFGMFSLVTGLALLLASVIAGALWDVAGPEATFLAGAVCAGLAALGLLSLRGRAGR